MLTLAERRVRAVQLMSEVAVGEVRRDLSGVRGMDVKVEWSGMVVYWTCYTRLTADYRNRGSLARDLARHHYHTVAKYVTSYLQ